MTLSDRQTQLPRQRQHGVRLHAGLHSMKSGLLDCRLLARGGVPDRSHRKGATTAARPNIVYIVADDLGWKDVGYHGSDIKTPNIDALAQAGRAARTVLRSADVHADAGGADDRAVSHFGTACKPWSSRPRRSTGCRLDEWLLPQALKAAGYQTAMVGKWHLGHADRKYLAAPARLRLSLRARWWARSITSRHSSGKAPRLVSQRQAGQGEGLRYAVARARMRSRKSLETRSEEAAVPLPRLHCAALAPYQAPKEYLDKYKDINDPTRRAYAAMITGDGRRDRQASSPRSTKRKCATTR